MKIKISRQETNNIFDWTY